MVKRVANNHAVTGDGARIDGSGIASIAIHEIFPDGVGKITVDDDFFFPGVIALFGPAIDGSGFGGGSGATSRAAASTTRSAAARSVAAGEGGDDGGV